MFLNIQKTFAKPIVNALPNKQAGRKKSAAARSSISTLLRSPEHAKFSILYIAAAKPHVSET
nr:hypothetical protein [Comamonas testosteroni]